MSDKLWQGRFSEKTARIVEAFTSSIQVDKRLYVYDIQGSIAHCKMLAKTSIITDGEAKKLIEGLEKIRLEIDEGQFQFDDSLEDIHMHIESRLVEIAGPAGQKLHTARSRNDQVALDVRMYLRDETSQTIHRLYRLQKVVVALAKEHLNTVLPGYTHMQRAQPILLSHYLMAYYEMFSRDIERLEDCLQRINVMPLGSAALAGTTYPIDRKYTADLLGFTAISANSIDAVADRDFIIEFLSAAAICMVHFSRLSEELILWSTSEFGFIELPDSFATGSSIMPQKKNPDVPELVRGKTGSVIGHLMALLNIMKSLPLAYNRDMQEDKAPLFNAADTLAACIEIYTEMLPEIKFRKDILQSAASSGFLDATDMADYLAARGMPFREAHHLVGEAVSFALAKKKELHELTLEQLQSFSTRIQEDVFSHLTTRQMIERRTSYGGTAGKMVAKAVAAAEEWLENKKDRLPEFRE
ncbi:MAG: argininosuccinate lyase [Desulfobacterales bacterium]|nr:argininosuccinate lyase [Deltaproteobacteria bacterium]NNL77240.1 argininosuccinate lyase [Desulfobacterales bacterium]